MTDPRDLSVERLEEMLLEATSQGVAGRAAMARVTAIRTILARRLERQADDAEENARRALEFVNALRGPDDQLTEIHPAWAASIVTEPEWAALYLSAEEMGPRR